MDIEIKNQLLEIVENSYINFVNNEFVQFIKGEMQCSPLCTYRVLFLSLPAENVSKYFDYIIGKAFGVWVNHIIIEIEEYLQKENYNATNVFDKKRISEDIEKEILCALFIKDMPIGFTTPIEPSKIFIAVALIRERLERIYLAINPNMALIKIESGLQEYKSYYVVNHVKKYFSKLFEQSFGEASPRKT